MPPSYGTPQPGDDAQLRAWRRRYAEETERGFSLRLPLALARRLRAEAAARGLPHSQLRRRPAPRRVRRPPRRPRPRPHPNTGRPSTGVASARRAGPG